MKVKTINRSQRECTRERKGDFPKMHRNRDPALHPFEAAREYTRAVNAVKMNRMFARPFIAAFGHGDGVSSIAKNPKRVNCILTGAHDGIISLWDVPGRRAMRRLLGHKGAITGISVTQDGEGCISCSSDCTVKLWKVPIAPFEGGPIVEDDSPILEFQGSHGYKGCDHHWERNTFATCGIGVSVWSHDRMLPTQTFELGPDSVTSVRFNPVRKTIRQLYPFLIR